MSSKFIKKQIVLYGSLKPCFCAAIGEIVYFQADGLHHLLYNTRHPRTFAERYYRATCIPYLVTAITKAKAASNQPKYNHQLWMINHPLILENKKKKNLKVIVRKIGNGKVHFLSAMWG